MLPPERPSGPLSAAGWLAPAWRVLTRGGRPALKGIRRSTNLILVSLVAAVVLVGTGPLAGTWAFFSVQDAMAANAVGTAKLFAPTDVTAVAKSAGGILLTWSAPSWAANGYSVRRGTTATGPFSQIGTTASGVT